MQERACSVWAEGQPGWREVSRWRTAREAGRGLEGTQLHLTKTSKAADRRPMAGSGGGTATESRTIACPCDNRDKRAERCAQTR